MVYQLLDNGSGATGGLPDRADSNSDFLGGAFTGLAFTPYGTSGGLWKKLTSIAYQPGGFKRGGRHLGGLSTRPQRGDAVFNVGQARVGLPDRGAEDLFPTSHLRYERAEGAECNGPTQIEIVEHAATCRKLIDQATAAELPERIQARVAEDERMFTYGERTVGYYHQCAQAFRLARSGNLDAARRRYADAHRLAELLRQDTTSVAHCYTPGAPNAFVATRATRALDHLAKVLGEE